MKLLNDDLDIAARRARQFRELEEDGIPVFDTHKQEEEGPEESGIWFNLFVAFFAGGLVFASVAGIAAGVFFFFKWVVNLL